MRTIMLHTETTVRVGKTRRGFQNCCDALVAIQYRETIEKDKEKCNTLGNIEILNVLLWP